MNTPKIIIAIDGHSSTGKSSFAKVIAARLNLIFIDTGALYRGVTLFAIRNGIIDNAGNIDVDKLTISLSQIDLEFLNSGNGGASELYLNGDNIEREIRGIEVSSKVSLMASLPIVREFVDRMLHNFGKKRGVVMDGRDIGTVVFPDAEIKIFMTADAKVRAMRRYKEMVAKGEKADFDTVLKNVLERDHLDETRENAPLRRAPDAILLDNSNMTLEDQNIWMERLIKERWG